MLREHMTVAVAIVLVLALSSCHHPEPVRQSKTEQVRQSPHQPDDWQRMKECTAQADLLATALGWDINDGVSEVDRWESHYSPKYQHCYVLLRTKESFTGLKRDGSVNVVPNPGFRIELWDAFENQSLAEWTYLTGEIVMRAHCTIANRAAQPKIVQPKGVAVDTYEFLREYCEASKEYIDEHMKK